ncbi:MAG: DUF2207 domain-containing protein, partial [Acidimicrobiia bacterium]|nr:DUF2207 domain-containing protein [Acidimicrobiia bacterium]
RTPGGLLKRSFLAVGGLLVLAALFAPAAQAQSKSFRFPDVNVAVELTDDGTVVVTENLTFSFSGSFEGAYRDIPVRRGETISAVTVSEFGAQYQPGGSTELGSTDTPGTFGVEDVGSVTRVVWHYQASDEERTFTVRYALTGLAVAYDDVVDINLQVWGDQWDVGVSRLTAGFLGPGDPPSGEVLVFGHPTDVDGSTSLGVDGVSPDLSARNIPAHQFVEMRVVVPRSVLTSTAGAKVVSGPGLAAIMADEQAEADRADQRAKSLWTALIAVALAFAAYPLAVLVGFGLYGSEPRIDYDREYEQAPPADTPPAIVDALARQGMVDERGFTATLFDLIRRGRYTATPATVEKATWLGLRTEQITDLEIGMGLNTVPLESHERPVVAIIDRIVADGPLPLTEFRRELREDPAENHADYELFKKASAAALKQRGLLDTIGKRYPPFLILGVIVVALLGALALPRVLGTRLSFEAKSLMEVGFFGFGITGVFLSVVLAAKTKLWVRRTREGALLNERWKAFRRYLEDFSRLEEAPALSLGLWEEYLVYGIALGVAEDVLEAARLYAPQDLEQTSSVYWYGSHGYSGGHSSNAISGIESALSGAFAPPASSGGGGGFSGGGGG